MVQVAGYIQAHGNGVRPSGGLLQKAVLLLPLLLFLLLSAAAHAQTTTGTTADGLRYTATSGTVTITSYSGTSGAVTIPGTISVSGSSLPVTSIGTNAFYVCTSLTGLTYYAGNADVTYTVQSSTDLQTWTPVTNVSAPDANNRCTATVPATGPCRFLRLVVGH